MESLIYQQIEDARVASKISYQSLAEAIGMSKGGLHQSIKSKKLTLKNYLDICEVLGIDATSAGVSVSIANELPPKYGQSNDLAETLDIISDCLKKAANLRRGVK